MLALAAGSYFSVDKTDDRKEVYTAANESANQTQAELSSQAPDSTRFTHTVLASGFDEPMQMALLPNYDVVVVERKGGVKLFDAKTKELKTLAHLNVFSGIEDGLLGVAVDPDYANNSWIYIYYGDGGETPVSHLTRFELKNGVLDLSSKKILLEIPTQRTYCCHSAGYITFDADGLLYLSVGDNTNAEEIEGHNPTDERPGRQLSDGQATSANTNDYRGKILRIKPEPDGTYSIPDGNLFPKDGSQGKPEIYVMGLRNPFRMSVDPKTKFLYWGDVGPDTEIPAEEGKLSYDEINQAKGPGFYGYPYFLGANEAFPKYDFETKQEGPAQDPLKPVNNSPNNTGIKDLPPAQPAFIWYGKGPSKRWPLVGKGGASAMAGPVYYSDLYKDAPYKLSDYYNGKLFIYDWVRKWILAVTMDEKGNFKNMEPFLSHLRVIAPIDMQFAPDGSIYLLAYGTNWFARNTDSGIIRVEFSEGNRKPVAVSSVSTTVGAAPLKVKLSAEGSKDFDEGDVLTYSWQIGKKKLKGENADFNFKKPGVYEVILTVTDQHGASGISSTTVKVGNTPPLVTINSQSNQTFYWDDTELDYAVNISDPEDKEIDPKRTTIAFNYLAFGKDIAGILASGSGNLKYAETEKYYATLDCGACHSVDTKSIGPSLKDVSKRYAIEANARETLAEKIIKGGSGNWGTYPMPPHPDMAIYKAREIADYILSLDKVQENIPMNGKMKLSEHIDKGTDGAYVLQVTYTDNGAKGIEPITSSSHLVLRNPWIQMEDYTEGNVGIVIATLNTGYNSYLANITNGKYVRYDNIDLTGIKHIRMRTQEQGAGGVIEVRMNSMEGPVVGSLTVPGGKVADPKNDWKEHLIPVKATSGVNNLYFVFKNPEAKWSLFHLDWMKFER